MNLPDHVSQADIDGLYSNPENFPNLDDYENYSELCDHVIGIMEALYISGDAKLLEHNLEELCHYFEMKLPDLPFKFEKEKNNE